MPDLPPPGVERVRIGSAFDRICSLPRSNARRRFAGLSLGTALQSPRKVNSDGTVYISPIPAKNDEGDDRAEIGRRNGQEVERLRNPVLPGRGFLSPFEDRIAFMLALDDNPQDRKGHCGTQIARPRKALSRWSSGWWRPYRRSKKGTATGKNSIRLFAQIKPGVTRLATAIAL